MTDDPVLLRAQRDEALTRAEMAELALREATTILGVPAAAVGDAVRVLVEANRELGNELQKIVGHSEPSQEKRCPCMVCNVRRGAVHIGAAMGLVMTCSKPGCVHYQMTSFSGMNENGLLELALLVVSRGTYDQVVLPALTQAGGHTVPWRAIEVQQ